MGAAAPACGETGLSFELTTTAPVIALRDLHLRWEVSTQVGSNSAYVTDAPINAFRRADSAKWKPGTVCDSSDSTWIRRLLRRRKPQRLRPGLRHQRQGGRQQGQDHLEGHRHLLRQGPGLVQGDQLQLPDPLPAQEAHRRRLGPCLNGNGRVTGCSLNHTVPAKGVSLYEAG
ncbi:hypothetical protein [Streptomyces sp. A0592]|uniref:hypothetical protein n=1 Tax=Streptomyces sp. A0592 TaxID=2563099 RepID=UPI00109E629E|nr:hypothetical protein [Streptomyces sp. A0592]